MLMQTRNLLAGLATIAAVAVSAVPASAQNIVEVAQKAGKFETLIAAAKAAGLVPALTGKGHLTVFAPTDAAFGKLPKGTVEGLLKPENKGKLAAILKYHVIGKAVYAKDIKAGRSHVRTLNGKSLTLRKHRGVTVNGAHVVSADVRASNGVIHVIDKVLIPK